MSERREEEEIEMRLELFVHDGNGGKNAEDEEEEEGDDEENIEKKN